MMKSYLFVLMLMSLSLNLVAETDESNFFGPVFLLSNFTVFNVSETEEAVIITTVLATDADDGQQGIVVYSIWQVISTTGAGVLYSTDSDVISINETSGEVSAEGGLNAEEYISHVVIIVASDQGRSVRQTSLRIIINVLDVNEPPFFKGVPYAVNITEEIEPPSSILIVTACDLDSTPINREIRYALLNLQDLFRISEQTGLIESHRRLDAELTSTYCLNVSATDSGNPSHVIYTLVVVQLIDINDNTAMVEQLTSAVHVLNGGSNSIGPAIRIRDEDIGPPVISSINISLTPSSADLSQTFNQCSQQCQNEKLSNANLLESAVDLLALANFFYVDIINASNCSVVSIARNTSYPEFDGYGEIYRNMLPEDFISGEFSVSFVLNQTSEGYVLVVPDQTNRSLPSVLVERDFAIWIRRYDFRFYYLTSLHSGEIRTAINLPNSETFFDPDSPVTKHYTAVVSASPPLVTLYVDCVLVGSAVLNGIVVSPNPDFNVFIGKSQPNPYTGRRLAGQLEGLYYHPVALRQSQIVKFCSCGYEALVLSTLPTGVTASISNNQHSITLRGSPTIYLDDALAVLRSINYTNQFDSPTVDPENPTRELIFTVTEDTGISFQSHGSITLVESDNLLPIVDLNGLAHPGTGISILYQHFDEAVFVSPEGSIMRRIEEFPNLAATFSHVVVQLTDSLDSGEHLLVEGVFETISMIFTDSNRSLEIRGPGLSDEFSTVIRALQYVNYNTNPTTQQQRTVTFLVTDTEGRTNSRLAISTIILLPPNPQLSLSADSNVSTTTVNYTVGSSGKVLAPNLTITAEGNSLMLLSHAVITIMNPVLMLDVIQITSSTEILFAFNGSTLLINGSFSFLVYQNLLSSLTFHSYAVPSAADSRIRNIAIEVFNGQVGSNVVTIQMLLLDSDPPVINLSASVITFHYGYDMIFIAPSGNITDLDSQQLENMTVQLVSTLDNDTLKSDNKTGRVMVFNQTTSAEYTSILRSILYINTAPQPSLLLRIITIQVCDLTSCTNATVNITFNAPPQLSLSPATNVYMVSVCFIQGSMTGLQVAPNISITDPNDDNLARAQVNLTSPDLNHDTLTANSSGNVLHQYNLFIGTLDLLGRDTLSQYEAALSSITFHSRDNASLVSRTVSIQVFDGQLSSNIVNIQVLFLNSPPAISGIMMIIFVIGTIEVPIAPLANITDSDSQQLQNMTVELEDTPDNDTLRIGNKTSRLLVFNQVQTPTSHTSMLRSVYYVNTAPQPSLLVRTITIQVCDFTSCNNAVVNISLHAPPKLSLSPNSSVSMASVFLELNSNSEVRLVPNITITDLDSEDLLSAEVFFTSFVCHFDHLTTPNVQGVVSMYNSATGVLNLRGQRALTYYQVALRSVNFSTQCTSLEPRRITIRVSDEQLNSNAVTVNVLPFFHVNSPPVITLVSPVTFQYNETDILLAPSANITDTDNQQLQTMTIALENILDNDTLRSGNEAGQILVFSQVRTPADFTSILRSIMYSNTASQPSLLLRRITIQVCDSTDCTNATVNITINAPPQITHNASTESVSFIEGSISGVLVALNISVTDPNDENLTRAEIFLHSHMLNSDSLQILTPIDITTHYNSSTGKLVLTGQSPPDQYQAALSTLTFFSIDNPFFEEVELPSRTITIQVFDDHLPSNILIVEVLFIIVNDPPEIILPNPNLTFQKNDAIFIARSANITDPDNRLLRNMTVKLESSMDNGSLSRGNELGRSLVFTHGSSSEYVSILSTILYINMGAKSFPLSLLIRIQVCDFTACADTAATIEIQDQTSTSLSAILITVTVILVVLLCIVLALFAATIISRRKSCNPNTKQNTASPPVSFQNEGAEVQPPTTEVHAYEYID